MDRNNIVQYIENSFLEKLIKDTNVTDISYNGYSIFYLHNALGRKESDIKISNTDARDFIRQISNVTEKQFSYQNPFLDVTAGKYRINATHSSIGRVEESPSLTFSLRISSYLPRITDETGFLTPELISLFKNIIKNNLSIVIGGATGTGKTEFQKYLIRKMDKNTRVIVIDNILELSQKQKELDIDMNVWQADERNTSTSIQILVKNALRNNPDWLIVAESRGEEMVEVLNAVMTGHPIITTIHAKDAFSMPHRLTRMVMMNDKKSNYEDVLMDVRDHFPIHVFLKRKITEEGIVKRYIDSIMVIDEKYQYQYIYQYQKDEHIYHPLPKSLLKQMEINDDELFIKTFGGTKKDENH
ncbi:MAG: CpaF/VirB11 family protein [Bacilli bacterium]|nr:CpaF/VirB11 family protein [Bacilli bacterium]